MITTPKNGQVIRGKFNGRFFTIEMIADNNILLEEMDLSIRFVTTLDNLRSFYEYAGKKISGKKEEFWE